MVDFRVVQFTDPNELVKALAPYDDSFMNGALGAVMDSIDENQIRVRQLTPDSRKLFAVYAGDDLLYVKYTCVAHLKTDFWASITMSKIDGELAWCMCSPYDLPREFSDDEYSTAVSLLASHLSTSVELKAVDNVFGSEKLVDLFVQAWAEKQASKGVKIGTPPPIFQAKGTYATLASIPPPSPAFSQYKISPASMNDVDDLARLYIDFCTVLEHSVSIEKARHELGQYVQLGQIWVCRVEAEIAGYCATSRESVHTIVIRNVYVSPKHRRKGIAEAMTRAMTRYYLGAEPLGFEGAPATGPQKGVKREVCLNVAEDHIERLYKRCGFLLGQDDRDPETGKKGWHPATYRAVEVLED